MNEYFPIRLNTLRPDERVTFKVFIKVGDKYIQYAHENDPIDTSRVASLKGKGVRKLFILPGDEDTYLNYLETGLKSLTNTELHIEKRASLAHDTLVTAAENAERTLETEEGFNTQKMQMNLISDFLFTDKKALKEILKVAGISTDSNQHAATVSSLALAIAKKLEGFSKEDLFELGTAALLHDIGKNRMKCDPMKAFEKMTSDEQKAYRNHPQDGADMLAGKPYISPRILGLIASHEERGHGKGFPEKKDLSKLPVSYQILSLANQFDHFCIQKGLHSSLAMDMFYDAFEEDYDGDLITVLATVLT